MNKVFIPPHVTGMRLEGAPLARLHALTRPSVSVVACGHKDKPIADLAVQVQQTLKSPRIAPWDELNFGSENVWAAKERILAYPDPVGIVICDARCATALIPELLIATRRHGDEPTGLGLREYDLAFLAIEAGLFDVVSLVCNNKANQRFYLH